MSETPVAILGINLCWLAWQPHALSLELLLVLKKKKPTVDKYFQTGL
jgi:hypothetical protein